MEKTGKKKFIFSFKYKISIAINIIILVLLAAIFNILQRHIEEYATENIGQNLKVTRAMVSALIEERYVRLYDVSRGLSGSELIRVILTDQTLDQITADDIIENEILPDYPQLSLLGAVSPEGNILAINSSAKEVAEIIKDLEFFRKSLAGYHGSEVIPYKDSLIQVMARPIAIGGGGAILIGELMAGITLSSSDLEKIKSICGTDIIFTRNGEILISTAMHFLDGSAFDHKRMDGLISGVDYKRSDDPVMTTVSGERFIYLPVMDSKGGMPPYIISKSLDKELAFVSRIKKSMINFGIAGLIAGMIAGFVFAFGISKPIKSLVSAASEIDRGNLEYEVIIRSRDEFSHLGDSFNSMIKGLNEKERIRGIMNRVVSREIAEEILKGELQLGGELRTATVLFTDIRGFTSLSETMGPKMLLDLLNLHFTNISMCIDSHSGNIDKYIGDAVMALFGVPVENSNHALNAVLAAIDIAETLEKFNDALKAKEHSFPGAILKPISIGTGINTGTVVAGLMGASSRLEYTAIGDEVNLASRLEGLTKHYGAGIIASEATIMAVKDHVDSTSKDIFFRRLDIVRVKGKTEGVPVYQIFRKGEISGDLRTLSTMTEQALDLLRSGRLGECRGVFSHIRESYPDDLVAEKFLKRVETYLKDEDSYRHSYSKGVFVSDFK